METAFLEDYNPPNYLNQEFGMQISMTKTGRL